MAPTVTLAGTFEEQVSKALAAITEAQRCVKAIEVDDARKHSSQHEIVRTLGECHYQTETLLWSRS